MDRRGRIDRYLQTLQLLGQHRRNGGELLGCPVPGDFTTAELLGGDLAVVGFIPDRGTQHATRAAELVPRGIQRAAHDERTVFRRPENHRVVGRGERAHATVGSGKAGHLVDGRESQIAVGCTAQRLVFVQERAVEVFGTGGRGEKHLAAGEVQGEPVAYRVNVTFPDTKC